jgi:hypothetical protein
VNLFEVFHGSSVLMSECQDLIGRAEEWAAIQLVVIMWLRERGVQNVFSDMW